MFDTHIQTTVSIRGHLIFLEYRVTPNWAVEWWLNPGSYDTDESTTETESAIDLLETLLRTHEHEYIANELLDEFFERNYDFEQKLAARTTEDDIPF